MNAADRITEAELEGAVLVLVIREEGTSTLWLDETTVDVQRAQQLLHAAAGRIPGDPDPEPLASPHD